jgi:hypothetical protein
LAAALEAEGGIELAGHKFGSKKELEAFIHSTVSHKGMYDAAIRREAKLKYTAASNYESAMAWKAAYEKATGVPTAEGGNGAGAASAGATSGDQGAASAAATQVAAATGATKESILKSIDWDKYKKIRETHDAETAIAWMVEQALEKVTQRYDGRIDEMTRPAKEQTALMEQGGRIGQQIDAMSEWTYDGTADAIYPELSDPDAQEEISQVIVAMHKKGLPLNFFESPEGINQAVLTWRDWRSRNKRPWSPNGKASSSTIPAADPHAAASDSVRRAVSAGTLIGRSAPARPAPGESGRGAEIVRGITESNKPTEFGWSR